MINFGKTKYRYSKFTEKTYLNLSTEKMLIKLIKDETNLNGFIRIDFIIVLL